jgi:methylglutaconyl-CoA hydratase
MSLLNSQGTFYTGECVRVENLPFGVKRLVLARPGVRNAMSFSMVREICAALESLASIPEIHDMRALVIAGEGAAFSAGADLNDMAELTHATPEATHANSQLLAALFFKMASFPAPTLASVQGAAIAGATGLLACVDHVVASPDAKFALPEARLGLVAATIAPYVARKIGAAHSLSLMLTARRVLAPEALSLGLVHEIAPAAGLSHLEKTLEIRLTELLKGSPRALRSSKALILKLCPLPSPALIEYTAQTLSEARHSRDGQDGIRAFFAHTSPPWCAELVKASQNEAEGV